MNLQKIEIAGVELNVPIPNERIDVREVTEMALPASSNV
jgi:hypothetical protein